MLLAGGGVAAANGSERVGGVVALAVLAMVIAAGLWRGRQLNARQRASHDHEVLLRGLDNEAEKMRLEFADRVARQSTLRALVGPDDESGPPSPGPPYVAARVASDSTAATTRAPASPLP